MSATDRRKETLPAFLRSFAGGIPVKAVRRRLMLAAREIEQSRKMLHEYQTVQAALREAEARIEIDDHGHVRIVSDGVGMLPHRTTPGHASTPAPTGTARPDGGD